MRVNEKRRRRAWVEAVWEGISGDFWACLRVCLEGVEGSL